MGCTQNFTERYTSRVERDSTGSCQDISLENHDVPEGHRDISHEIRARDSYRIFLRETY